MLTRPGAKGVSLDTRRVYRKKGRKVKLIVQEQSVGVLAQGLFKDKRIVRLHNPFD